VTNATSESLPGSDAGWVQGVLLAVVPAMVVLTVVAVIPIIPKLSVVFASTPNARVLVPMAVVLPTLALAFSSIAAGVLGERMGRRRLLEIGTALFAATAIAPFWLDSFPLILVTRAAAGVALGAMTTSAVALTGDYFSGASRQRWLAIQGVAAAAAGVVTSPIAGALGDISWRLPFLLLALGFPLLLALILLPAHHAINREGQHEEEAAELGAAEPVPWRALGTIFALAILGCLIISPPAFELGLVFQEKKLGTATLTGLATSVLAAGAVAGALGLGLLRGLSAPSKMALVFAVGGVGTLLIAITGEVAPILVGAVVVGISEGMMGPVLSIWVLDCTPALARGRVIGLYSTTFYLTRFVSPLIAGWITGRSASTSSSMVYYALASAASVGLIVVLWVRLPALLGRPAIS